ncbi:hypothetical protein NHX12_027606 [Muraenolepis orangiensis]|uniref:Uncharacterized protein n=1 Tax=Muraenolepis orangiensis TaxID=630683 RepID=A0A9Q0IQL5_9TELE|nr:hypothetical protein NHX12_027606 [Muraenolepis orangiensis]
MQPPAGTEAAALAPTAAGTGASVTLDSATESPTRASAGTTSADPRTATTERATWLLPAERYRSAVLIHLRF